MKTSNSVVSSQAFENEESDVQYRFNATPPWPEWSEEELASTNWNTFAEFRYRDYPSVTIGRDREFPSVIGAEKMRWRRLHEIFPNEEYQVIEPNQPPFIQQDVFASNRHLMETELLRTILYCLKNVSFLSYFKTPTEGASWEPWTHVHKPEYNPHGKYLVRLFYLGKWRRIVVDDFLPCDETGQVLVPFISSRQLWLPLLVKGILVVAGVSGFARISNLLTGCFSHCVEARDASASDMWGLIDQNVPRRKDADPASGSMEANGSRNVGTPSAESVDIAGFERYVLALVDAAAVPNLRTGVPVNIQVVICQCHLRTYAKHWRDIRYNQWAYEKGILKEKIPSSNAIGHIQIFCPVRRIRTKRPPLQSSQNHTEDESRIKDLTRTSIPEKKQTLREEENEDEDDGDLPPCDEICTWLEFPDFYSHLVSLETLYVPSTFEHQTSFTSEEDLVAGSTCVFESHEAEEGEEEGDFIYHDLIPQSSLYLFSDNLQTIDIFLVVEKCHVYSAESSHLVLKHYNQTQLVVEPYCWRDLTPDMSDERTIVCTQPVKLTLNPGINVFKLWYNADGHFLVGIFGTGEFQTVSRCKLNLLLSQVSLHVSQLVTDIVTKLSTLLQAGPGTWEHGTAYTAFIEAFCPRKYFDPGTNINERVQIKVEVLQKLESLLMENILSYNFDSVLSTIAAPNSSSTSLTNPLDGVIVQAILQCQEIFQDAVFGERYLELNAPHYHRLLVSFKQTSASQLTVKKGSKLSKLMKSSMSLQQKKTKSKLTAATASKFSILNSLLGDIIERNASEFFTLLAATPGVETADVISLDLRHHAHIIELSGVHEMPPTQSWSILARLNLNVHTYDESLVGVYFFLANAANWRLRLSVVRNSIPCRPLTAAKMSNHIYRFWREEFGYTILLHGYPAKAVSGTEPQDDTTLRWNLQLISEPGPDSVLHLCRLYPALESPLSPKEEYDPRLICDYGPVQAVPPVIMTQWFDHIESDTKFDRLKFSITTWPGNIVTLRFALDSTDYSVTLNIIKRGGGGGGGGGGEECGDGMRSCVSFVMEEETLEIGEHDRIILSQRSTTGEVTVASIVTTHQTCNYNDELVLEGTVEIAFNPAAETPNEELLNAKVELIKSYLTHDESDYSERYKELCENQPVNIDTLSPHTAYSFTVAYTSQGVHPDPPTINITPDYLGRDPIPEETTLPEAIARGRDTRQRFLAKVYKDALCLVRTKRKIPQFEALAVELFGRVVTESPEREIPRIVYDRELNGRRDTETHDRFQGMVQPQGQPNLPDQERFNLRAFYEKIRRDLEPSAHDETRDRLYREREAYIRRRNFERQKYAPIQSSPVSNVVDIRKGEKKKKQHGRSESKAKMKKKGGGK